MSRLQELEQEMDRQTLDLYSRVTEAREADVDLNTIQKMMDKFLVEWSGRLTDERETQIKAARADFERQHPDIMFDSTVETERERASQINSGMQEMETDIKEQISDLRSRMFENLNDIDKGREPDIALEPAIEAASVTSHNRGTDHPQTAEMPETWEQLAARKMREAGIEPSLHREDLSHELER